MLYFFRRRVISNEILPYNNNKQAIRLKFDINISRNAKLRIKHGFIQDLGEDQRPIGF
jgi:hypothetical protein